jgi:hypothetical protein
MPSTISIASKLFIMCLISHIDGTCICKSPSIFLRNGVTNIIKILRKDMHLNHHILRGGGHDDADSPRASHLGPDDAFSQPIPKAAIDFRIRARKKMTNKAGKQLKRRWIGGAPIPKAQLRQEEASRRAEKNAAYARFDVKDDERLPTAKVDTPRRVHSILV